MSMENSWILSDRLTNLTTPKWTFADGNYRQILSSREPRDANFRLRDPRSSGEVMFSVKKMGKKKEKLLSLVNIEKLLIRKLYEYVTVQNSFFFSLGF